METLTIINEKDIEQLVLPVIDIEMEHDFDDFTGESIYTYDNPEQTIDVGEIRIVFDLRIDNDGDANVSIIRELWLNDTDRIKVEVGSELDLMLTKKLEKTYSNPFNRNEI